MKYVKRDTFQKIIERTLQFKFFSHVCPLSCIQTKINAYIFMSHLKLKVFQKLQIKCSHFGTAGKDGNEWKDGFTSLLERSRAVLNFFLAGRIMAQKSTLPQHRDRTFFQNGPRFPQNGCKTFFSLIFILAGRSEMRTFYLQLLKSLSLRWDIKM